VLQFVSVRSDLLGASDLLQQAALDKYSFVRDAYTQQRRARLRGTSDNAAPLPNYDDQGDSGAAAPAAGAPVGLPNYADPGDAAEAPNAASGAATGAPAGVPNYTDPGDTPASGAAGAEPSASATAPAPASATPAPSPQTSPADDKQPAEAPVAQ
jgi:phospholipid-binding lipoprotein MlaA